MMKDDIPKISLNTGGLGQVKSKSPVLSPQNTSALPANPTIKLPSFSFSKRTRIILIGLGVLTVVLVLSVSIPGFFAFQSAKKLGSSVSQLESSFASQDLNKVKGSLTQVKKDLASLERSLIPLAWLRIVPKFGAYVKDASSLSRGGIYAIEAGEVLIPAIEPYADILGFGNGQDGQDGAKTAQERINFIVESIDDILPKLGEVGEKLEKARDEIGKVDPQDYPENFRGTPVREKLRKFLDLFEQSASLVIEGRPLLEAAPFLLGIGEQRTYLVIFQNDKELRATGGFMTAYAVMKVKDGKFDPVTSNDIYNLDSRYKRPLEAPEPIRKYLKGPYTISKGWFLRDMNYSPDFASSMELFLEEAQKAGLTKVDGVIAVDTKPLVDILNIIGRIGVPGYGNYSTEIRPECNCPQVIYDLETYADIEGPVVWDSISGKIVFGELRDNRKGIVGPLMNSILANAMGQPKEKVPLLFEAAFNNLREKHVLFYLFDDKAQAAVESFNIAGRIRDFEADYLSINDSNFGGRKSNLYLETEVEQKFETGPDGEIIKTLTITYKNPQKHDGWLNSVLPNWTRVYVPKGSILLESSGFESEAISGEDLGKTVFSGFFELRPLGVVKVVIKYRLPVKPTKGELKVLIQKQPGVDKILHHIEGKGESQEFYLKEDREIRVRI